MKCIYALSKNDKLRVKIDQFIEEFFNSARDFDLTN